MKNRGRVAGSAPWGQSANHFVRSFSDARPDVGWRGPEVPFDAADVKIIARSVTYACPKGHDLAVRFHAQAAVPQVWECVLHRQVAALTGAEGLTSAGAVIADLVDTQAKYSPKTHWEHVLARRTTRELEELLEERLAVLRGGPAVAA